MPYKVNYSEFGLPFEEVSASERFMSFFKPDLGDNLEAKTGNIILTDVNTFPLEKDGSHEFAYGEHIGIGA